MKKLIVLAAVCMTLASCRFAVEPYSKSTQLPDASKEARDSVRLALVVKGDTTGMGDLEAYCKQRGREIDMLPFYVVLADKYGNDEARVKIVETCRRLSAKYPRLALLGAKYGAPAQPKAKDDETKVNDEK